MHCIRGVMEYRVAQAIYGVLELSRAFSRNETTRCRSGAVDAGEDLDSVAGAA
jgi:hypothetical protein